MAKFNLIIQMSTDMSCCCENCFDGWEYRCETRCYDSFV